MSKSYRLSTSVCLAVLAAACAPRESYVAPVDAFGAASAKLNEAMAAELEKFRTDTRIQWFREDLRQWVDRSYRERAAPAATGANLGDNETYICIARAQRARIEAARNYIASVSNSIKTVVQPPPEEFEKLLAALAKDYSINVSYTDESENTKTICKTDLTKYLDTVYPRPGSRESVGEAYGAAKELFALIGTIVTGVLREVDSARRAAALRDYFAKKENRDELNRAIVATGGVLSSAAIRRRHFAVKDAVDSYDALVAVAANAANAPRRLDGCKALMALDQNPGPSAVAYRDCYRAVWNVMKPALQEFATAAAAYDIEADKLPGASAEQGQPEDPAITGLKDAVGKLADIADGKVDRNIAEAMLATLIRWQKISAQLVKDVSSEETEKKVREAVDKISTAL